MASQTPITKKPFRKGQHKLGISLKESMLRTLQHDESRQYIHLDESILKGID